MPRPILPGSHTSYDAPEQVAAAIQNILVTSGGVGMDFWHGLTNFGQFAYQYVLDLQNGIQYKVFLNDDITFQYSDGWTEKWQFLGTVGGSVQWQEVPNSLKDPNGNPPSSSGSPPPPTTSNTTPQSGGGEGIQDPIYGLITMDPLLPDIIYNGGPGGVVIYEPPVGGGDGVTSYESYN
jgi:hypothetical protein